MAGATRSVSTDEQEMTVKRLPKRYIDDSEEALARPMKGAAVPLGTQSLVTILLPRKEEWGTRHLLGIRLAAPNIIFPAVCPSAPDCRNVLMEFINTARSPSAALMVFIKDMHNDNRAL